VEGKRVIEQDTLGVIGHALLAVPMPVVAVAAAAAAAAAAGESTAWRERLAVALGGVGVRC